MRLDTKLEPQFNKVQAMSTSQNWAHQENQDRHMNKNSNTVQAFIMNAFLSFLWLTRIIDRVLIMISLQRESFNMLQVINSTEKMEVAH